MAGRLQEQEQEQVRVVEGVGEVVEVPQGIRQEAGLVYPVLVDAATWADVVAWGAAQDAVNPGTCQMESGRLWDLVWMLRMALVSGRGRRVSVGQGVPFSLYRVPADRPEPAAELVHLRAVVHRDAWTEPFLVVSRDLATTEATAHRSL